MIQVELTSWEEHLYVFKWSAAGKETHCCGHDHRLGLLEFPLTHGKRARRFGC